MTWSRRARSSFLRWRNQLRAFTSMREEVHSQKFAPSSSLMFRKYASRGINVQPQRRRVRSQNKQVDEEGDCIATPYFSEVLGTILLVSA